MDPEELDSEDYTSKFSDYFDFKAIIGKGAFGTVISAVSKSDSREYAIKVKTFFLQLLIYPGDTKATCLSKGLGKTKTRSPYLIRPQSSKHCEV